MAKYETTDRMIAYARGEDCSVDVMLSICRIVTETSDETRRTVAMDCLPAIVKSASREVKETAVKCLMPFLALRRPRNRYLHAIRALGRMGAPALMALPELWALRRGPFLPKYRIRSAIENIAWSSISEDDANVQIVGLRLLFRNSGPESWGLEKLISKVSDMEFDARGNAEIESMQNIVMLPGVHRIRAWGEWTSTHPLALKRQ